MLKILIGVVLGIVLYHSGLGLKILSELCTWAGCIPQ